MKKILLVADSNMSLSGVPVVFMSIVRLLHNEYTFDIIVLKDNDMYFEKEFTSYGGKVYRFNFNKPEKFLPKFWWLVHNYPKEVKSFINNNINLSEYSAIHSFQEGFSYPFFKEANKVGIERRILHINSANSAYSNKKTFSQMIFNWYQKKAEKYCTNIIFVSNQAIKLNDYKKKGLVLYNVYDEKKYGEVIACDHDNLALTQIGTLSSRKNQLFSLKVLLKIISKYKNAQLYIVGKELEPNYLKNLKDFINNNNLSKNVTFANAEIDKKSLYTSTSFVLYPSVMESFGLVLIESQACGIHCFANKDLPHDADMGNVDFIGLDSDLWAKKIIEYYEHNGNKRKEPINKDRFSTSQFVNTLKDLYN